MTRTVPLAVLASIDPLRREVASLSAVLDRPRTVVVTHDLDVPGGSLHRVVADVDGVVEDVVVPLDHACLSCAVREDAVPTIARLVDADRWDAVLLALPVTADSLPVTRTLAPHAARGGRLARVRVSSVVATVDLDGLVEDLLGDDLLADRELAFDADDDRTVGEALAAQLVHADLVCVSSDPELYRVGSDLLDHVRADDGTRLPVGSEQTDARMFGVLHDVDRGESRADPRRPHGTRRRSRSGVWTTTLRASRPFHPERLVDNVRRLGGGRLHTRGVFFVPSRPGVLCAWEGAGGQVSIGEAGQWGLDTPRTELRITGLGDEEPRIRAAFDETLLTDDELYGAPAGWTDGEDALEPWLGERD